MSPGAGAGLDAAVARTVARITAEVRRDGDAALRRLTRRFDGARRAAIEVGAAERRAAERLVEPGTLAALRFAARRIAAFARLQKSSLRPFRRASGGVVLEQRLVPIDTVGVYVPGGRHPLCSTVLMGAVPARVAGCRTVIVCTPPRPDGSVAPEILAAARLAGVDRVFAVGGAQAIAAMAWGTRAVPAVDLIVGPGNRYVAAAKALVAGQVGIDFIAGPTELVVIADGAADPERVAADLLGQAEHDPEARLALFAVGRGVAAPIVRRLGSLLRSLPEGSPNRAAAAAAVARLAVRRCASLEAACRAADARAPEHLSIQTRHPRRAARRVRRYGSLFLGGASAVAFGDYVAGPNHILPTSGAAAHTGGLSALRFLKTVTVQEIAPRGARRLAPAAAALARVEGLEAHRASILLRSRRAASRRAVLFDFDGVLVDSERVHWRAFREVLAASGVPLTWDDYRERYLVLDDRSALEAMVRDAGLDGAAPPLRRLVARKQRLYRRLRDGEVGIDGRSVRLVRALAARAPLAIVSGAARAEIEDALRRARLGDAFRVIVAAEDVPRPKPDPTGYRQALRRLGADAGASVAIEDSPGGIRAARAAGLAVLGVAGSYGPGILKTAGARRVAAAVHAFAPGDILAVEPIISGGPRRRRRSSR